MLDLSHTIELEETHPGDKPFHRANFVAPIQATPYLFVLEMAMKIVVESSAPLSAVVLSSLAIFHPDHSKIWGSIRKSLEYRTLNDGLPSVRRLHDLDRPIDSNSKSLLEVAGCSKTSNQKNGADRHVTSRDLVLYQPDYLKHNGLKDGFEI
jgi:hypothetical protein